MKVGEYIIISWAGSLDNYLVQVEAIESQGVRGPYQSFGGGIPHAGICSSYMFNWSLVSGFRHAGGAVFKQHNAPISLDSEYSAVVSSDKQTVKVGCRTFSREAVLKVAEALK